MTSLFKTPKAPAAPDPVQLSQQQAAANAETARLQGRMNRLDERTPYGNVTYQDLGGDRFQRTVQLNPEQQRALDAEQRLDTATNQLALDQFGRISQGLSNPFTLDGLPTAPVANDSARQRIEDALFSRATRRLDPQFARDEEALRTRLANQGIAQGSAAYNTEMETLMNARNDALATAREQAIAGGGQEQSRLFGLEDTARQRAIGERVQQRSQPINEIAALLGTGQVQGYQPGTIAQVGVNSTDVLGANSLSNSVAMNTYNQRVGSRNALINALGTAAGYAAMSDRRVKENIKLVGRLNNGLNVYAYNFIGNPQTVIGVMAQEVEQAMPEAVSEVNGIKHVDYGMITDGDAPVQQ